MSLYIYPTDHSWYYTLRDIAGLDEVNFWLPGGRLFKALKRGDILLFRLKSPINKVAGGGLFAHASVLPLALAWSTFGVKNGTQSFEAFAKAIAHYRKIPMQEAIKNDVSVGCVILIAPFFLDKSMWFPTPQDYSPYLVQGKGYSSEYGSGAELLKSINALLPPPESISKHDTPVMEMYGDPALVRRRLGQGSFRTMISDLYHRQCAVTGEHTMPILQAAHIKPVSEGGLHATDNGILLRSDVHILFDQGFITVDTKYRVRVSSKLKELWDNGVTYYQKDKELIILPKDSMDYPNREFLEWHNDIVFQT